MKILTSVTVFNDAVGKRMSLTYSEVDGTTGQVIKDNSRIDRVITDPDAISTVSEIEAIAQSFIDSLEG